VRVVDCETTVSTFQGRGTGAYRLVATLTDSHAPRRRGQSRPLGVSGPEVS
jgi:hypothetical protein